MNLNRQDVEKIIQKLEAFRQGETGLEEDLRRLEENLDEAEVRGRRDELGEKRQLLDIILRQAADAIIVSDEHGKLTFANSAALALSHADPSRGLLEQDGNSWEQPYTLTDQPIPREERPINRALNGETSLSLPLRLLRPDGSHFDVLASTTPLRDSNQRIVGAVSTLTDISNRVSIEEALVKSEERFHSIFSESPIGIEIFDADGRLLEANRACLDIFGVASVDDIKGFDLFSDPNLPDPVKDKLRRGERIRCELPFDFGKVRKRDLYRTSKSRIKHLDISITPISQFSFAQPQARGYLVQVQDIDERKRAEREKALLEEELRQSQKMEAIGRLAGGVAHDFNNLLSVIIGYSNIILEKLHPDDPLHMSLGKIRHAGELAASLTHQLLAFSRKQILEMKVINLNELVSSQERLLRRLITEEIELLTVLGANLGNIKADPTQIEQILMNLVINARDAMPEGGKLVLETANAWLDEEYARTHPGVLAGAYVMLAVSDTGHGMTDEVLHHIFEPFFTTKQRGQGTGLGLSTVYGIVQQHNGSISVTSRVGQGTRFRIYFPSVNEPPVAAEGMPEEQPAALHNETVLVVEDDELVRKLAYDILISHGYHVLTAQDPSEALAAAERYGTDIQILLTDIVLPQMNGRELYRRIAADRPRIRVLYMSGYSDSTAAHLDIPDPALHFLQKPFSVQILLQKIRALLES